jgi:hypothetical protein
LGLNVNFEIDMGLWRFPRLWAYKKSMEFSMNCNMALVGRFWRFGLSFILSLSACVLSPSAFGQINKMQSYSNYDECFKERFKSLKGDGSKNETAMAVIREYCKDKFSKEVAPTEKTPQDTCSVIWQDQHFVVGKPINQDLYNKILITHTLIEAYFAKSVDFKIIETVLTDQSDLIKKMCPAN